MKQQNGLSKAKTSRFSRFKSLKDSTLSGFGLNHVLFGGVLSFGCFPKKKNAWGPDAF